MKYEIQMTDAEITAYVDSIRPTAIPSIADAVALGLSDGTRVQIGVLYELVDADSPDRRSIYGDILKWAVEQGFIECDSECEGDTKHPWTFVWLTDKGTADIARMGTRPAVDPAKADAATRVYRRVFSRP